MKRFGIIAFSLSVLFSGCCSKKSSTSTSVPTSLFHHTWELEYISGIRIAFEGLYPENKPFVVLKDTESQFGGNTSCNVFSGTYHIKSNSLQFGPTMKTMAFCEGGGEETFLKTLEQVNRYTLDKDGKLVLLHNETPIMRFKKIKKS